MSRKRKNGGDRWISVENGGGTLFSDAQFRQKGWKVKKRFSLFALVLLNNAASAGSCGEGKIIRVLEGGWNTDDYMIKIDYSVANSAHAGTEFNGYIVYKSTLNTQRLNGIRSVALAAYMAGKNVKAYSHANDCSEATEISVAE